MELGTLSPGMFTFQRNGSELLKKKKKKILACAGQRLIQLSKGFAYNLKGVEKGFTSFLKEIL